MNGSLSLFFSYRKRQLGLGLLGLGFFFFWKIWREKCGKIVFFLWFFFFVSLTLCEITTYLEVKFFFSSSPITSSNNQSKFTLVTYFLHFHFGFFVQMFLNFFLIIFCIFWFFFKKSNVNIDLMRKINYFKNDPLKAERIEKKFKI